MIQNEQRWSGVTEVEGGLTWRDGNLRCKIGRDPRKLGRRSGVGSTRVHRAVSTDRNDTLSGHCASQMGMWSGALINKTNEASEVKYLKTWLNSSLRTVSKPSWNAEDSSGAKWQLCWDRLYNSKYEFGICFSTMSISTRRRNKPSGIHTTRAKARELEPTLSLLPQSVSSKSIDLARDQM